MQPSKTGGNYYKKYIRITTRESLEKRSEERRVGTLVEVGILVGVGVLLTLGVLK